MANANPTNPTNNTPATPAAPNSYNIAFSIHLQTLTPAEKQLFQQYGNPRDVLKSAEELDQVRTSSGIYKWSSSFSELAKCLENYLKIVDALASNAGPHVVSIVWGALRFLIEIAKNFSQYFEKMKDIFEAMSDALAKYADYDNHLFREWDIIKDALIQVYGTILTFLTYVFRTYKLDNGKNRSTFRIALRALNPWKNQLSLLEADFRKHSEKVKDAALHAQLRNEHLNVFVQSLGREGGIQTLQNHNDKRAKPSLQPCRWLLELPSFHAWKTMSNDETKVLWCYGKSGSGKTVLASSVVECFDKSDADTAVTYFYCSGPGSAFKPEKLCMTFFLSILNQLMFQLKDGRKDLHFLMDYVRDSDGDPSSWPLPVLANIVEKIATKFTRFFLIMDGLDDIPSSELAQVLDVLEDLRNTRVKKLRMAVFSRDIVAIRQWLSPNVEVPCTASDTATDIEAYIGSELDKHLKFPEMKDRVKDKLAEGADGMFLWASLATKYICHLQTEDDIRQSLLSFPPDINTAYADAIGRILNFPGKYATQRGIAVLTWVLGAACPLTLNELAEAVAIEEMDGTHWDGSKVVKDPRVLIENCAGLCVATTRDTVVLIHNSVADYLFEYRMTMGDKFLLFPENLQEVHLQLAESCLKYMKLRSAEPSKGVQSEASSEPKRKNWNSGYLADYIFWHFVYHCRLAPTERRVLLEKRTEEVRGGRMNKLPGLHHPSNIPELHQNCERAISVVNPHGDTDALSDVEAVTLPLFRALNTASPGILSFSELSAAYRNRDGDGTSPFEEGTVRLLIAKFDTQFLGGITAAQFTKLHAWVESWTAVFDKVDRDGDGMIRSDELVEALKFLGFTVSVRAMALFERRYAERSTDGRMGVRLDRFIKSCVTFEAVKGKFHERDTRKEGFIHLTLEQLLDTFLDTPV